MKVGDKVKVTGYMLGRFEYYGTIVQLNNTIVSVKSDVSNAVYPENAKSVTVLKNR